MKQTNIAKARPGQPMGANTACSCSAPARCPCYKAFGRPGLLAHALACGAVQLFWTLPNFISTGIQRQVQGICETDHVISKSRMAVPVPHRNSEGKKNSKCRHQFLFKEILTVHRTHACVQIVDLRLL